ncbi:16S rRNA (uracil(1498)-N(3))-methyltransferase [hydrothermal vent metagenome]|uniref:16S rRNA (uracil(1498)-N(3))-methyltransferase n=1 Tax=hydrothermal vent metagenome TaxID=652676 RepID=A0A3B0T950_9ZZZZ
MSSSQPPNPQDLRVNKRLQRLLVGLSLSKGAMVDLDKAQSSYLVKVLRKKIGDQVILFNGRDGAWLAQIDVAERKLTRLQCLCCLRQQPQIFDLWYGFAPLKSARLDYMVQKATEMGASIMQPVITSFTQKSRLNYSRMRSNVIEAAEQCEILNVPQVLEEISFEELLANWKNLHGDRVLIFADEAAQNSSPVEQMLKLNIKKVGLLIGPEGGFSKEERELLLSKEFVFPISLGPRILRADTAAVAALALIQSTIGDR